MVGLVRPGIVLSYCTIFSCFLQMVATNGQDAAVLREARADADRSHCHGSAGRTDLPCPLNSWNAATEPCGGGWNISNRGWLGVMCNVYDGRVVSVTLYNTDLRGELLPFFGRLGALLSLALTNNRALSGNVADLAGATELRFLQMVDCHLVRGEVGSLASLKHLGGEFTLPHDGGTSIGGLYLARTGVHGPVAGLRALPGLGADWGPDCDHSERCRLFASATYTPCSAFGGDWWARQAGPSVAGSPGCGAAALAPVDVTHCRSFSSRC